VAHWVITSNCHGTRQALRLKPEWVKAYFRIGKAQMEMKRYEDAAHSFWEGFKQVCLPRKIGLMKEGFSKWLMASSLWF
jgi:hypothetical protein